MPKFVDKVYLNSMPLTGPHLAYEGEPSHLYCRIDCIRDEADVFQVLIKLTAGIEIDGIGDFGNVAIQSGPIVGRERAAAWLHGLSFSATRDLIMERCSSRLKGRRRLKAYQLDPLFRIVNITIMDLERDRPNPVASRLAA